MERRNNSASLDFLQKQVNCTSISLAWAANVGFELIILNTAGVVLVNTLEERVDVSPFHRDLELSDQVSHLVNREMPALIQIEIAEDFL